MPQHLAFALTEPTFGKKAQGQGMGADRPATQIVGQVRHTARRASLLYPFLDEGEIPPGKGFCLPFS